MVLDKGRGSNSLGLRRYNERVILTTLRQAGNASKSDLARASHLTPQAVTRIVDELEKDGLVIREGRRLGGKGQPSTLYRIDPGGSFSIGVSAARRSLDTLLMDFGGNIIHKIAHEYTQPDPDLILEMLAEDLPALRAKLSPAEDSRLLGVGVGMPWFIGSWAREIQMDEELVRKWSQFEFMTELEKLTDLPLFLENDCSAAAIAELLFGRGKTTPNFLYVFLGTIVGAGLILEGGLEVGIHGNSAHIASMPVPPSTLDSADTNGQLTTLLDRASLFVLRHHLNAHGVTVAGVKDLPEVLDDVRPMVQEWLDDCANALVYAFRGVISVVDLQTIVIDGYLPAFLIDELVEMVSRRLNAQSPEHIFVPEIEAGEVGMNALAIGAALLPINATFAPDKTVLLKGTVPARVKAASA